MKKNITGIILAGGKSSRMGAEKGLVTFRGQPLIHYPLQVLETFCSDILISSNTDSYAYLGCPTVPDTIAGGGPMIGIYSCLMKSTTDLNAVISCDMPFVTAQIYHELMKIMERSSVCVPWHGDDHYEPVCGLYRRIVMEDMRKLIGEGNYRLPDLFRQTDFRALPTARVSPRLSGHYFFSINGPADLGRALGLPFTNQSSEI